MNTLAHDCKLEGVVYASTAGDLKTAITQLTDDPHCYLDGIHRVELWAETLSDGSVAMNLRVRRVQDKD